MAACPYAVAELVPHAPPMVLLDEILAWDDVSLSAVLTVRPDSLFFEPGQGIAAHVGIEWMAQACGAFAGLEAKAAGESVRLGFLLGTRRYRATVPWFFAGERLVVSVKQVFRDGGMGVFDCRIEGEDAVRAVAQLIVYQPEDASLILSQQAME